MSYVSLSLLLLMMTLRVEAEGQSLFEALDLYKETFSGDATYYGDAGGKGSCGYGKQNPPVCGMTRMAIALNRPQYLHSYMCGSCWKVTGLGRGLGTNPVKGNFTVFVNDLCPECQPGDVDLGVDGDGRWDVVVQAVQCPVGIGNIEFKFEGSNSHYIKLQVRNTRLPVYKMEVQTYNWEEMTHTTDGHFTFSGRITGAFQVRLTAINGAQLMETISEVVNDKIIHGSQQFPEDPNLLTVKPDGNPTCPVSTAVEPLTSVSIFVFSLSVSLLITFHA